MNWRMLVTLILATAFLGSCDSKVTPPPGPANEYLFDIDWYSGRYPEIWVNNNTEVKGLFTHAVTEDTLEGYKVFFSCSPAALLSISPNTFTRTSKTSNNGFTDRVVLVGREVGHGYLIGVVKDQNNNTLAFDSLHFEVIMPTND